MVKNRIRIVTLLMALVAGSLGFAVFAAQTAPPQPANAPSVTVQGAQTQHTGAQGREDSTTASEAASESSSETESAAASDGPGGSQHDFQGEETGQH